MKVFFETYGCSANVNDSEIMMGQLHENGHEIVDNIESADCIVVNTCTVKGKTENHIKKSLKNIQNLYPDKKLVVGGCMVQAQTDLVREIAPNSGLIGTTNLIDISNVVEGKQIESIKQEKHVKVGLPKVNVNPHVSIIQINNGCLGACTFCITKRARLKLISYPPRMIREEIRKGVASGVKEFWITSQDTGAYGAEIGINLVDLLQQIIDIDGDFKVRLGMMNPDNIMQILNELVECFSNEKLFKFIHVPVQAGNNEILKKMNRRYSVEEFKKIVDVFREKHSQITVATDVICGFPGETEEQFNDTLELVKELKPEILNISRFWVRPGTVAEKMEGHLNGRITKERSTILTRMHRKITADLNKKWIGWTGRVFFDEKGVGNSYIGRNFAYKPIVVKNEEKLLGIDKHVEIIGGKSLYLEGKII